jgi:aminomethyltransferase
MLALDVARIEAGLILLDVDYIGVRKALIPSQRYSPYEIGLGRLVHLDKAPFIGQAALRREARAGRRGGSAGSMWTGRHRAPARRGRPCPAVAEHRRRGWRCRCTAATTGGPGHQQHLVADPQEDDRARDARVAASEIGSRVDVELTVDHRRRRAGALVVALPFFDPPRKRA